MRVLVTGGSGFIGTNLVEKLLSLKSHQVLNMDSAGPHLDSHIPFWNNCSIMDLNAVEKVLGQFQPEIVIHLAARTDTDPQNKLEDYVVNTTGSENLIKAIEGCPSVQRVIFTSTQFVNQYNGVPAHDEDFAPHTVYGETKVMMERMIREAKLKCEWTIIRPTNIWGPWHIRYPSEFWKIVSKGFYVHPGRKPVIRSYGYVGNVVAQIIAMMEAPSAAVDRKVFYVGDEPIDIYHWVNGFSMGQVGKPVRVVPRFVLRTLALGGDVLAMLGIKFPITSSRYRSMTNSNSAPMTKTLEAFGEPPYSLEQGIEQTVDWMKKYHPDLIRIS